MTTPPSDPTQLQPERRAFADPPPSQTMARWALGLAAVPCCGLTNLVGIGLAIAVLVRSRGDGNHGRGKAIAAILVGVLWSVIASLYVGLGVGHGLSRVDRNDQGDITSTTKVGAFDIADGDCFDYRPAFDGTVDDEEVQSVVGVPCSEPHEYEVMEIFTLPDGHFPDAARLERLAQLGCDSAFRGFVGIRFDDSDLDSLWFVPTKDGWEQLDDRAVTCFVGQPHVRTTGTLEGSAR